MADLRTTDARLYLNNLEVRIGSAAEAAAGPKPVRILGHAAALYERYRVLGKLEDYEHALAIVEKALADRTAAISEAHFFRASLHLAMHRFEPARADVDAALATHAKWQDLEPLRAELALALGKYADAARIIEGLPALKPGMTANVALASLRFEQGRTDEAMKLMTEASGHFRDVSPLPLAWLTVSHGILYLRLGDLARAREFFAAAHERLPEYALATEHLGETELGLGHHAEAAALYRAVAEQTGNPEFWAQLANALRAGGDTAGAAAAEAKARAGWDEYLKKHPEAYWDHAARWHLDRGEAKAAVELARKNAALRGDVAALSLLAEAEAAAGDAAAACKALGRLRATGMRPPELAEVEKSSGAGCGVAAPGP